MENGGILPRWIQILLLGALNILPGELLFSIQTRQKDVNSLVNMVPCVLCKHQGSSELSGSVHQKKGNNSAEKEDFLSLSLSLFSFPETRKMEIEKVES